MGVSILSHFQSQALELFKKSPLATSFYLSGGTALAEFYLHHRQSEDLDFFTQEELNLKSLQKLASSISQMTPLNKIEFQRGFGLYTFFFYPQGEVVKYKIDFGQYPFGPIEPLKIFDHLKVESLFDLAVNKAQTLASQPRARDFIDLYFILQAQKDWSLEGLLQQAHEKFEMFVDPIQLGQNLLQVRHLQDLPIMLKRFNLKEIQNFFLHEAKKLKEKVLK
jgi:predicted nucleotidyltransferase component of viral defense system